MVGQWARGLPRLLKSARAYSTKPIAAVRSTEASVSIPSTSSLTDHHGSHLFYQAKLNEQVKDGRYQILARLGSGLYSTVWLAKDLKLKIHVALKVLRSDCYGGEHDIFELEILEKIKNEASYHPQNYGANHVTQLVDHFNHKYQGKNHVCLVLPLLGHNLLMQAWMSPQKRIPNSTSKIITRQLLQALDFLHGICEIIHTDLQPNNICFEVQDLDEAVTRCLSNANADPQDPLRPPLVRVSTPSSACTGSLSLQILDFGVASWVNKRLTDRIQPEHLRAPEVILGAPWGTGVDIWSLGCMVIEFVKGHVAFPGSASAHGTWSSEDDHLAQYMEVLGPMPEALLSRGRRTAEFFDKEGKLLRIPKLKLTNLQDHMDGTHFPLTRPEDMSSDEMPIFVDFLRGALALDPDKRKTAAELLKHPWLET